MTVKVQPEREILNEVADLLLEHLSPSKVARFWATWQVGEGDYTRLRRELFAGETIPSLLEKVRAYEAEIEGSGS